MSKIYNVQCTCGHVFPAAEGSPLEQKCIDRERAGYIDALAVHGKGCPVCEYRDHLSSVAVEDDESAMFYMFDDKHPNAVDRWLNGETLG